MVDVTFIKLVHTAWPVREREGVAEVGWERVRGGDCQTARWPRSAFVRTSAGQLTRSEGRKQSRQACSAFSAHERAYGITAEGASLSSHGRRCSVADRRAAKRICDDQSGH